MPRELLAEGGGDDREDTEAGVGLFRGRFGTEAAAHALRTPVFLFPARYPDRTREGSHAPELNSIVFSRRIPGAIWKRVDWDELSPEFTTVEVVVRFDGTPDWDSSKVHDVNAEEAVGGTAEDARRHPRRYLHRISGPSIENRLDVQADMIEIRFRYRYEPGAFDPTPPRSAKSWKETPRLEALRVEYLSPTAVHLTEDLR